MNSTNLAYKLGIIEKHNKGEFLSMMILKNTSTIFFPRFSGDNSIIFLNLLHCCKSYNLLFSKVVLFLFFIFCEFGFELCIGKYILE